jgi:hypothetical protein
MAVSNWEAPDSVIFSCQHYYIYRSQFLAKNFHFGYFERESVILCSV